LAPHGNRRVGVLKAEPTVAKNRMSRGRLSDCSGSTIGKMEVRVLTHSQAVGSACERRESIACARGLSTPSALSRRAGSGKNALALAASSTSSLVAVRTETVHGLRNDRGMPVFTPGSNPRRLPAAACRRGSCVCIDHSAKNGPRAPAPGNAETNVAAPFEVRLHYGLRDPGEEHPLNVALSQNTPRLRVFYVRFSR